MSASPVADSRDVVDSVAAPVAVELHDVGHRFGRRVLFAHLTARFEPGEVIVVAGRNGSGKTTLLRLIAGLVHPSAGRVAVTWHSRALSLPRQRRSVGYASPDTFPYRPLTVRENLAFAARVRGLPLEPEAELVDLLGLTERLDQPVAELSSGYVQRVRLALAVAHRPPVLLLDEPSATLDDAGQQQVAALIERQQPRGITMVGANDPRDIAYGTRIVRIGG